MSKSIIHRGPDSSGDWIDKKRGINLAHRRLSILDLSEAGHQPMVSFNGRYQISYNGEIYNHLNLRKDLESNGVSSKCYDQDFLDFRDESVKKQGGIR